MPFSQLFPRTFSRPSILAYAPAAPGIYGISNARRWLAIAQSDNIQHTLLALCAAAATAPSPDDPSGFVFELCDPAVQASRLQRLTQEYLPPAHPRPSHSTPTQEHPL